MHDYQHMTREQGNCSEFQMINPLDSLISSLIISNIRTVANSPNGMVLDRECLMLAIVNKSGSPCY